MEIPHMFRTDGDPSWRVVEREAERLTLALHAADHAELAQRVEAAKRDVLASWPTQCKRTRPGPALSYLRALEAFHVVRRLACEALSRAPAPPQPELIAA